MRQLAVVMCVALAACSAPAPATPVGDRLTILYDAFGRPGPLRMDWGYAALVEIGGRRILFDTGNNSEIFEHNVRALGVDLTRLDFAVISHRHGDHTDGLRHLLAMNPSVTIYAPRDLYFGGPTPGALYRRGSDELPAEMKYFGGRPPDAVPHGTPWAGARFVQLEKTTEVAPGVFLIPAVSQSPGTMEMAELSLSVRTPRGQVIVCGCSHPGIEKILDAAVAIDPQIRLVAGGLHLAPAPDEAIGRIATALRETYKVGRMAPGHCTGEPAFAAIRRVFADRCAFAGLGTTVRLDDP